MNWDLIWNGTFGEVPGWWVWLRALIIAITILAGLSVAFALSFGPAIGVLWLLTEKITL